MNILGINKKKGIRFVVTAQGESHKPHAVLRAWTKIIPENDDNKTDDKNEACISSSSR